MRFVVIAERTLDEWAFVGIFEGEGKEKDAAQDAIRQAALADESSDHFKACPIDEMEDKRVAYRRRVVGLQT